MIFLADCHIMPGGEATFFQMLEVVARTEEDVVFLGDIFDLWIAVPRYEAAAHIRFLDWCRREKRHRRIYFLEGNHEFFVANVHGDAFTEAATEIVWRGGGGRMLLCHGERFSGHIWDLTRLILGFVRSRLGYFVVKWAPFGPFFSRIAKRLMGHRPRLEYHPPFAAVQETARRRQRSEMLGDFFLGHYHEGAELPLENGAVCHVLPAWRQTEQVLHVSPDGSCRYLDWRELPDALSAEDGKKRPCTEKDT